MVFVKVCTYYHFYCEGALSVRKIKQTSKYSLSFDAVEKNKELNAIMVPLGRRGNELFSVK